VVEAGAIQTLYQCKDIAEAPGWTQVREAVVKFEAEWLDEADLPRPNAFVYCCPHPLDDSGWGKKWMDFRDAFCQRTGIDIGFWDRNFLDARLRHVPDIVAGLFSGSYAEHFCNRDDWLGDPWTRVRHGVARHDSVGRFLDRHARDAIIVDDSGEERFQDLLSASPVLAVRGLRGSGKTLTVLELHLRYLARSQIGSTINNTMKGIRKRAIQRPLHFRDALPQRVDSFSLKSSAIIFAISLLPPPARLRIYTSIPAGISFIPRRYRSDATRQGAKRECVVLVQRRASR